MDNFSGMFILIIFLVFSAVALLIGREIIMWYFRINEFMTEIKAIRKGMEILCGQMPIIIKIMQKNNCK